MRIGKPKKKRPIAHREQLNISKDLYERFIEMFRKPPQKDHGLGYRVHVIFLVGMNKRGVLCDFELLKRSDGGCATYPEVKANDVSIAMTELLKRNISIWGFGRLCDQDTGGLEGYWSGGHYWNNPHTNFLNVNLNEITASKFGANDLTKYYKVKVV